jgi:squalene-hopene/tetraprenyl-beta-curcumene cyclase
MSPSLQIEETLIVAAGRALRRASDALVAAQHADGYWWADLTADTTLESDYILLELWLHPPAGPAWNPPTRARIDRAVRSILDRQLADGGFNIYARGPSEISASVKAYFALKVAGLAVDDPNLDRLRRRILELGGIQAANSYTKINLSLFNLFPRRHVPSVPPEIMLLGNLVYEMSSWSRAIVIPLAIVQALNPGRPVPDGFTLEEIFLPGTSLSFARDLGRLTWRNFFVGVDLLVKFWERHGWKTLRRRAIAAGEKWMLERFRYSDGLGAIYPPMMYAIMALDLLGYGPDRPERVEAQRQFERLLVDRDGRFYFQPCFSPVWDTAIVMFALGEAGLAPPESMRRAADWVLTKEVRRQGDWSVKRPGLEPSGWYFEFANEFYPDIDDTAMVLLGLRHAPVSDPAAGEACRKRAVEWLLNMQSRDGGWAAFDVDNDWEPLSSVPFADHNAMLDPTCPDITGRVMEGLCAMGVPGDRPAIRRGVAYLLRTQELDGSWYGRWGVNYVYGTFLALRGLRAAGQSDREAHILRAGEWLRSVQNADGGWGESCASYDNAAFTAAESTASQTAWAILGLLASGDASSTSVVKGIEYLVESQRADGAWHEELSTGTGFPKVFYLTYHSYRNSFPLAALAGFLKARPGKGGE